ncbi:cystein proteinase inhibitor protein salarin [Drosophila gunungcola]|uniref:cystein proteinase inhibitor protein salarin n=1 Tax=Drosophila gunungcola TaxID=103775 RepID=UPI0022E376CD|nr:cystein proteinase inhibitor protein salarin [Drosophila gunungcola]
MGSALLNAGVPLFLILMGVAWGLPTITPKIESGTEANSPIETTAPPGGSEVESQCHSAWQKFLIDFDVHYESEPVAKKRRNIFCENWQKIQNHNLLYESGVESFKKGINQFSDLTFEEWKQKQQPRPKVEATKEASKDEIDKTKCLAAWNKFLIDFGAKYQDDGETEKRHRIFCDNWRKIQDHNLQYESGVESFKKSINQFSDLTFEEWKEKQRPIVASEFSKLENTTKDDQDTVKCQAAWKKFLIDFEAKYKDQAETEKRRIIFCDNWQKIQKHNLQYESGVESFQMGINHFSDLTFEEWKLKQSQSLQRKISNPNN